MVEMCIPVFRANLTCRSLNGIRKSSHSRRNVPPKRSQNEFVVGALSGVPNTRTPMVVTSLSLRENAVAVVNDAGAMYAITAGVITFLS